MIEFNGYRMQDILKDSIFVKKAMVFENMLLKDSSTISSIRNMSYY